MRTLLPSSSHAQHSDFRPLEIQLFQPSRAQRFQFQAVAQARVARDAERAAAAAAARPTRPRQARRAHFQCTASRRQVTSVDMRHTSSSTHTGSCLHRRSAVLRLMKSSGSIKWLPQSCGPIESTRRSCPAGWLALTLPLSLVRDDETGCMLVLCPACGPLSTSIPGCIAQDSRQGSGASNPTAGPSLGVITPATHVHYASPIGARPPLAPVSRFAWVEQQAGTQAPRHAGTACSVRACLIAPRA